MKKYDYDLTIFKKIDSHEKAYWLGFLYADGNLLGRRIAIGLSVKDVERLELYKKFLKTQNPVKIYGESCQLQFNSLEISEDLRRLGMIERKSLILKFPTDEMVSEEFLMSFILGYFDGDGSIYKCRKTQYSIKFVGSDAFIISLREIFLPYGIKFNIEKIPNVSMAVSTDKKSIKRFYELIYEHFDRPLQRKKARFEQMIKDCDWEKLNRPKHSKYKWVTFDKRKNKWLSSRKINQKNVFIGYFASPELAYSAALDFQRKHPEYNSKIQSGELH